ncbi:MAG: hypothetical protein ACK5L6_05730 [Anaerorhabdus sp.]|uniref:hypothetical protein n=1 Tax=Anaerorhabdus sp. TaxID=1872524 RepID=UPI003A893B1D
MNLALYSKIDERLIEYSINQEEPIIQGKKHFLVTRKDNEIEINNIKLIPNRWMIVDGSEFILHDAITKTYLLEQNACLIENSELAQIRVETDCSIIIDNQHVKCERGIIFHNGVRLNQTAKLNFGDFLFFDSNQLIMELIKSVLQTINQNQTCLK